MSSKLPMGVGTIYNFDIKANTDYTDFHRFIGLNPLD
jgi:hypothetical protein